MKLPPPLNWLWKGWMAFSEVLGKIMSFILLTILWIIGFGLYAIVMKIGVLLRKEERKTSYWLDVPTDFPDSMKHQF